ncbi:MAG TPA: response regulator [Gammaproteobacteria bacterium]|nr:response regulator [Gammaproteobacteria bacterium]
MALNIKDYRFLIIDDLREMRMTVRGMLESLKVKVVHEARSGDEALEILSKNPIDVVLCDYNLGEGRDGQQTLEEAKGRELLLPTAAWIMITAEQAMSMVMGVVENNPDGYLVKPINKSVLQARIERVIGRKQIINGIEAALKAGEHAQVVRLCDQQLEKFPALKADLVRFKTEALIREGDYDAAAEICAGLLAERELPWTLLALGRIRYETGDLRQAKTLFQKVVERHPTVMEGYDWLARVEHDAGAGKEAQRIIQQALAMSPRSLRRQQTLGDVAAENSDYATAEKAYDRAVQMGEDSCYARPDDQAGLISSMMETKGPDNALRMLAELNKKNGRKKGAKGPHWRLTTVEATLLGKLKRKNEAVAAAKRALDAYKADTAHPAASATLALVRACYENGLSDEGHAIVDRLVRENHDRHDVIDMAKRMFDELGMQEEGATLIDNAQQAIIKINNEGVLLAKAGRYKEALSQLQQAAEELPNNLTVLMNVVQALLLQMNKEGASNQARYLAQEHLARAEQLAPRSEKVAQLRARLAALSAAPAKQATA